MFLSCHVCISEFPVSIMKFLDIQATIECGFTLKRVRDMIRTYSQMHRTDKVLTTQLNHLASLAKWLSVRLRTKWLWVRVPLQIMKRLNESGLKRNSTPFFIAVKKR